MACYYSSDEKLEVNFIEEVWKRRLCIDRRGTDSNIQKLVSDYVGWVNSNGGSEEQDESRRKKILTSLEKINFNMLKTMEEINLVADAKAGQENIRQQIKDEIKMHRRNIAEILEINKSERLARKRKSEYEAVVILVQSVPDQRVTEVKRDLLEKELQFLQAKREEISAKITNQKQKLALLFRTAKDLAATMEP